MSRLLLALGWWRPLLGAAYLFGALFAVLPAPAYPLFVLAVGVTEWGHFFAVLCLTLLLPGWERVRGGPAGALFGATAFLLALTPLLRATLIAGTLERDLAVAFGTAAPRLLQEAPPRPKPLVFADLPFGVHSSPVARSTRVYARPGGQELEIDLYLPASPPPHPIVVVLHGGSWRGGDKREPAALNRYLAAHGYLVAAPDYRLAPRWRFPAAADDVAAALAWLKAQAFALGADPERIVLLGRSAGGQLALLAAVTARDPAVRGAVALYAPTDLNYAWENPANPLVLDTRGVLRDFLGGSPEEAPQAYAEASPLERAGPGSPPILLIHGGRDEMVFPAHAERMQAKLRWAGVRHLSVILPWATHGFDYNFAGPGGQLSTYAIERFLAAVTAP